MIGNPSVPLSSMVTSLTNSIDLVSEALVDHHKRVAHIAFALAEQMGLSTTERDTVVLAGALHDVGAVSDAERFESLAFDFGSDGTPDHARVGFILLRGFRPLADVALVVRHHHVRWDRRDALGAAVPAASHLIHLADRIAVLVRPGVPALSQAKAVVGRIKVESGRMFCPTLVEAFEELAARESFWLGTTVWPMERVLQRSSMPSVELDVLDLVGLAKVFSRIIDFRSSFTATHSSGVAAAAATLSRHFGFCQKERRLMEASGYLHDLGKLAVPSAILEKAEKLTQDERDVMRTHTFHTFRALEPIAALRTVAEWAALHHERIDGSGYPFRLQGRELSVGSRIMAVSDVFTALTENRPYRAAMVRADVIAILRRMVEEGGLDPDMVATVARSYDEIDGARAEAQSIAAQEFRSIAMEEGELKHFPIPPSLRACPQ